MIASRRSPRLNAAHRRRRYRAETTGLAPMARSPCRISHCAIPIDRNGSPDALLCRNLTTHTSPDDRAVRIPSGQAPISNPHR